MVSPLPSHVVIKCPNCGTRYQLPPDTIGPQGRHVACAHCGGTWKARPLPQTSIEPESMFDEAAEAELDARFGAAEVDGAAEDPNRDARERTLAEIRAAVMGAEPDPVAPPQPVPAGLRGLEREFRRRQAALNNQLPFAKLRRAARLASVAVLILLVGGSLAFRTDIVRRFPDLAGAYEALGLGVNVVGLEFRDVTTLVTLRNGSRVMRVDGRIFSIASRRVAVPNTLVTLLDERGAPIYEWSIAPEAGELEPGEIVDFTAQLASPPEAATRVRVGFTEGHSPAENL
jgi:predicted Zn finger-like uncharacterized protein